jgi:hypothetical protein
MAGSTGNITGAAQTAEELNCALEKLAGEMTCIMLWRGCLECVRIIEFRTK